MAANQICRVNSSFGIRDIPLPYIVYEVDNYSVGPDEGYVLWAYTLETGRTKQLTGFLSKNEWGAVYDDDTAVISPNQRFIKYNHSAIGSEPDGDYIMLASGHLFSTDEIFAFNHWMPDSKGYIGTTTYASGYDYPHTTHTNQGITTVRLDNLSTYAPLATPAFPELAYLNPTYNYDGTKIAFWIATDKGVGIFNDIYYADLSLAVMDADGTNIIILDGPFNPPNGAFYQNYTTFAWAKTSNSIAYGNQLSGVNSEFYRIDADGTNKITLWTGNSTRPAAFPGYNTWLPDDSGIVMLTNDTVRTVDLVRSDGSGIQTSAYSLRSRPQVVGNRIYYLGGSSYPYGLYSLALDLTDPQLLVSNVAGF